MTHIYQSSDDEDVEVDHPNSRCAHAIPLDRWQKYKFEGYLGMKKGKYGKLLNLVGPRLDKTRYRSDWGPLITAHEKLTATLRLLVTGVSIHDFHYHFDMMEPILTDIFMDTCYVIRDTLKSYVQMPHIERDWREVADDFLLKTKFPHCLGVLGSTYIPVIPPPECGQLYLNDKNVHSMVLLVLVDADHNIMMADAESPGSSSGLMAFEASEIYERLMKNTLNLPAPRTLLEMKNPTAYTFIGGSEFTYMENLLTPYPSTTKDEDEARYNGFHSSALTYADETIRQVKAKFRILETTQKLGPAKAVNTMMACCCLHNFIKTRTPVCSSKPKPPAQPIHPTTDPKKKLVEYFRYK